MDSQIFTSTIAQFISNLGIGGIFLYLYIKKDKDKDELQRDFLEYHKKRIEVDTRMAESQDKLADALQVDLRDAARSQILNAVQDLSDRFEKSLIEKR